MGILPSKRLLLLGIVILLLMVLPVSVILMQNKQENRSRATASTTLYFSPASTSLGAMQYATGDTVSFDVMIDPGTNLVSLVKLQLKYDPAILRPLADTPFTPNSQSLPTTIEGPVVTNGNILISLSVGADSTKVIQTTTKVGKVSFIALAPTGVTPTTVSFGDQSQILSVAKSDQATENVLSTVIPAYIAVTGAAITSPVTPTVTAESPTPQVPTATPAPSTAPSPTQESTSSGTTLSFTVSLHGIGNGGDNANPNNSSFSNKNPVHTKRDISVQLFDNSNQLVGTYTGMITYDPVPGDFTGSVDVGNPAAGAYQIKVKSAGYLNRLVPGIHYLSPRTNYAVPAISLITGDVNNDNILNILDYNLIINCYSDLLPAIACDDSTKAITDLDDDGNVNQFDYNLYLREVTSQNGD